MKKSVLTGCIFLLPSPGAPFPSSNCRPSSETRGEGRLVTGGGDSCRTLTKKGEEAKGQRKTFVLSGGKQILAPFSARSCLPSLRLSLPSRSPTQTLPIRLPENPTSLHQVTPGFPKTPPLGLCLFPQPRLPFLFSEPPPSDSTSCSQPPPPASSPCLLPPPTSFL